MYSVTRNISLSATMRISMRTRATAASAWYDADIKNAYVGDGLSTFFKEAATMTLPPVTSGYVAPVISIVNPRILLSRDAVANSTLSGASVPPTTTTDYLSFSGANLTVTHLDAASDTDTLSTIEFSTPTASAGTLTNLAGADGTTIYNRAWLVADSVIRDYQLSSVSNDGAEDAIVGVTSPTVTFDAAAGHLWVVPADNGAAMIDTLSTEAIIINRTDLLTDAVGGTTPIVLGCCSMRDTAADDVSVDLMTGTTASGTTDSECAISFRMVI